MARLSSRWCRCGPRLSSYDVAILGGGLAGLTLAIQLKRERPDTSVVVLEKREGPGAAGGVQGRRVDRAGGGALLRQGGRAGDAPEAAPPGQVRAPLLHADRGQQRPLASAASSAWASGRRRTTFRSIAGCSRTSWRRVRAGSGSTCCRAAASARSTSTRAAGTRSTTPRPKPTTSVKARWVVDAAGRASLLEAQARALEGDPAHDQLRLAPARGRARPRAVGRAQHRLDVEDVRARLRQYSTNHLLGEGYWVWLIPLSTGPISIGICADPRIHPFEEINELDSCSTG